ncbi:hypothetical protein, partial [Agathobaculum butyriciproducens]|uniref:hypothetical protein n=1 Tax=Agathobaculum butyriciproducens TaxID=1628085 RepID=UPI003AB13AB7
IKLCRWRQYHIIEQERFASKFCVLIRRGFAAILDVLQKNATTSGRKISVKRRSLIVWCRLKAVCSIQTAFGLFKSRK